jgi:hypothetical protein
LYALLMSHCGIRQEASGGNREKHEFLTHCGQLLPLVISAPLTRHGRLSVEVCSKFGDLLAQSTAE